MCPALEAEQTAVMSSPAAADHPAQELPQASLSTGALAVAPFSPSDVGELRSDDVGEL